MPRACKIPKGGAARRAAEPKTKGQPFGCPFVLEQVTRLELAIAPHKSTAFVGTPHLLIAKNAATPHF